MFPNDSNEMWIGVANVVPDHINTQMGKAKGAFVKAVCLATSALNFQEKVSTELFKYEFTVVSFSEVELFKDFSVKYNVACDLQELVDEAFDSKQPVFSSFHTYLSDENIN